MSNLTLQLDAEALREATMQAMSGVLTPEVKEKILQSAIRQILEPETNPYSRSKDSPLERALQDATIQLARQEAKRMLEEDEEFKAKVQELLRQTAAKVIDADMEKLSERMADAFVSSMRKDY